MKIRINGELHGIPRVRVIGPSGEALGVMTLAEGLRAAMKAGMVLVEVDREAEPPVCKVSRLARRKDDAGKARVVRRREGKDDER